MNKPWRPSPGALVQIWDHQNTHNAGRIDGHGKVGYVVKQTPDIIGDGPIFEVIVFHDEMASARYHVWYGWLREIKKTSDIKIVLDKS